MMTEIDNVICDRKGEKQPFDDHKLYASVYHPARECNYDEQEAEELADEIVDEVSVWIEDHEDDVITSKEIRHKVISLLNDHDEGIAFMYKSHLDIN